MSEFVDRMNAQRSLLRVVNASSWREELFGLSSQAIHRWTVSNGVSPDSEVVTLLRRASERLNFLASRSQLHITQEYQQASHDFDEITNHIREKVLSTQRR